MSPLLEIFSQGEEIVTGQTIDTNAAWLAQQGVQLGFQVTRHSTVGDKLDDLISLMQTIAERADCCFCTGGLGPTSDDLTALAVAKAFGLELIFDAEAYSQMQRFFALRQKAMPETNRKQALLPSGSVRLDNAFGTAPGFALQHQRCWFVFMPGVPSEMKPMFLHQAKPDLLQRFPLKPSLLVTLKSFGLGESEIQQRLQEIVIPPTVQLGFRAALNEVQTKLLFAPDYPELERLALLNQINAKLGTAVFATVEGNNDDTDLAITVQQLMTSKGLTLALIETASQGMMAALCAGADWLLSSQYQANDQPSTETTNNLLASSGADIVLSQSYSATLEHFSHSEHSIELTTIITSQHPSFSATTRLVGTTKRKQTQAALFGLDCLRRFLLMQD